MQWIWCNKIPGYKINEALYDFLIVDAIDSRLVGTMINVHLVVDTFVPVCFL